MGTYLSDTFTNSAYFHTKNIIGDDSNYAEIGTPLRYAIKNKYIYIPQGPNVDYSRKYLYDANLLKIIYQKIGKTDQSSKTI